MSVWSFQGGTCFLYNEYWVLIFSLCMKSGWRNLILVHILHLWNFYAPKKSSDISHQISMKTIYVCSFSHWLCSISDLSYSWKEKVKNRNLYWQTNQINEMGSSKKYPKIDTCVMFDFFYQLLYSTHMNKIKISKNM